MAASLARLARLLLGAASLTSILWWWYLASLGVVYSLPRCQPLSLPRRIRIRIRLRLRLRCCRRCRRLCRRARVAHLYESPTLIRTRRDSEHCQDRGLCSKRIVEDLGDHQPNRKVNPHVPSEEACRRNGKQDVRSNNVDYRKSKKPGLVDALSWFAGYAFVRTTHCIYANLKRAKYTVMQ